MFSLLAGIWRYLFSKAEMHVLIIGLDYAGKTTLLEQLKGMFGKKSGVPLDKIPPTVGLNIARVEIKRCKIIFWDLGGQERLRAIWDKYYREADGLVFVIDSADHNRFREAEDVFGRMQNHPELRDIPVLILANKQDLPNAETIESFHKKCTIQPLHDQPFHTHPISAISRMGIDEGITWLIDAVKSSKRFQSS